jgi:hypothetical protein
MFIVVFTKSRQEPYLESIQSSPQPQPFSVRSNFMLCYNEYQNVSNYPSPPPPHFWGGGEPSPLLPGPLLAYCTSLGC